MSTILVFDDDEDDDRSNSGHSRMMGGRNSNVRFSDTVDVVEGPEIPVSPSLSPQLESTYQPSIEEGGVEASSRLTPLLGMTSSTSTSTPAGKGIEEVDSSTSRADTPGSACSQASSSRDPMSNSLGVHGGNAIQHLYGDLPPTPDRSVTPEVLKSTAVYLEELNSGASGNTLASSATVAPTHSKIGGPGTPLSPSDGGGPSSNPPWIARRNRHPPPGSLLAASSGGSFGSRHSRSLSGGGGGGNSNSFTVAYTSPTHRRGAASSRSVSASSVGSGVGGASTPTKSVLPSNISSNNNGIGVGVGGGASSSLASYPPLLHRSGSDSSIDGGQQQTLILATSSGSGGIIGGGGSNSSFGNNSSAGALATTGDVTSPNCAPMVSLVPPAAAARRASIDSNVSMAVSDCSFVDKGEQQSFSFSGNIGGSSNYGSFNKSPQLLPSEGGNGPSSATTGYLHPPTRGGGSSAHLRASPQPTAMGRMSSSSKGGGGSGGAQQTAQYLLALQSTNGLGKSIKDVLREGYQETMELENSQQ